MKRFAIIALLISALLRTQAGAADSGAGDQQQQQIARAVKELQEQQAQIADNQAKIEAKLAVIAEAIRQARIFVSRGGSAAPHQ